MVTMILGVTIQKQAGHGCQTIIIVQEFVVIGRISG